MNTDEDQDLDQDPRPRSSKAITWLLVSAIAVLILLALLLFPGCKSLDRALLDPQVIMRTNTVQTVVQLPPPPPQIIHVTNTVAGQAQIVTNIVQLPPPPPQIVTNYVVSAQTNYVVRPEVLGTAQAVGGVPLPWAGLAGAALGWLATLYANVRNKKLATALVQGIEEGRQVILAAPGGAELDNKIRDALIRHQELAGVLNAASRIVNEYTGDTRT